MVEQSRQAYMDELDQAWCMEKNPFRLIVLRRTHAKLNKIITDVHHVTAGNVDDAVPY